MFTTAYGDDKKKCSTIFMTDEKRHFHSDKQRNCVHGNRDRAECIMGFATQ